MRFRSTPDLAAALVAAATSLLTVDAPLAAQRAASNTTAVSSSLWFSGVEARLVGPHRGGRSTAVTGVAGQPHRFFMGTTGGGVWTSDDAGHTWRNISDGWFGGSIGAIAIAPSDANVLYAAGGSVDLRGNSSPGRGAWRSTDGGRTWDTLAIEAGVQVGRLVVDPRDPLHVYAAVLGRPFATGGMRGVYRSRDGGRTFDRVLFADDSTGATTLAMDPTNPRILFAAMWRAERKPWTMRSGSSTGGLFRSDDGGDTWTKVAGGFPQGVVGKIGVTISPADPQRVWAIVEAEPAGGVYRSDDGGRTWARTNSDNSLRQRAWYYTHVRADPRSRDVVYALNTGLYRSVDGGKTFTNIPVPHGDVHDLWVNPDDPDVMIVADDGGAQVSLNHGRTWSTYFNQPTAELYDVITDNRFPFRIYSAQQDNTTFSVPAWWSVHDVHPFATYAYASGCETGPVALHPDRPEILWGGCYGGSINRWDTRTDQRRNVVAWPQLQLGQAGADLRHRFQWVAPILVSRHDPNVVYHASQHVLRTRDGGMTWAVISPDLTTNTPAHQARSGGPINNDITGVEIFNTIFALAEDPRDANVLWAGSDDGRLHVTRDGGANWREVTPPGMPRFGTVEEIVLSPHDARRVYVAAQAYRMGDARPYVFRSDDGGATWRRIVDGTNGIPADHPVRAFAEDPVVADVLYAGTEYGLFTSTDGGARWRVLAPSFPTTPVTDLEARVDGLVIATQGRSLWLVDDLTPVRAFTDQGDDAVALLAPLPAVRAERPSGEWVESPVTVPAPPAPATLHYWLANAADSVSLEIVDARGTRVRRWTSDSAQSAKAKLPRLEAGAGLHRVGWDVTYAGPNVPDSVVIWGDAGGVKAPPGTYTVRLATGGVTREQSLVVRADPRLPDITQADYDAQFRLATAIRDTLDRLYAGLRTLRDVNAQATMLVGQAERAGQREALAPLADSLRTHLRPIETTMTQVKSQSGQDPIRFGGMLDNQWIELYGNVTGRDGYINGGPEGRPTAAAGERFDGLAAEWRVVAQRLADVLARDVAAFNAVAERVGVGRIVLPDGGRGIVF